MHTRQRTTHPSVPKLPPRTPRRPTDPPPQTADSPDRNVSLGLLQRVDMKLGVATPFNSSIHSAKAGHVMRCLRLL